MFDHLSPTRPYKAAVGGAFLGKASKCVRGCRWAET